MNDTLNMAINPFAPVTMTREQRDEALKDKEFWDQIESLWRGNNVDFVVKAVLAGRSNDYIFSQLQFPQQTCEHFKASCFRAFDYVRAKNWEVLP